MRRRIMDRDIMAEKAITAALVPVPDIGLHFTGRKDFLVGIDTSIGGIFVADIDGTLDVDICTAGTGMLAAADTSVMDDREMVIEAAAIVADD